MAMNKVIGIIAIFFAALGRAAAAGAQAKPLSGGDVERIYTRLREQIARRSEEHTSELQSRLHLVCRLLLEKKKTKSLWSAYSSQTTTRIYFLPLVKCSRS